MLERFLTVPPLKKILQFQERISFFLENTKTTSPENVDGEKANLILKRMLEGFIKDPWTKKLEFQNEKKSLWNLCKKKISNQKSNRKLKT